MIATKPRELNEQTDAAPRPSARFRVFIQRSVQVPAYERRAAVLKRLAELSTEPEESELQVSSED
jgi:hypothetical protein